MSARALAGVLAALVLLALPATAPAAFTAQMSGTDITLSGSDAAETLALSQSGGLMMHNRQTAGDPGFASDFDWSTFAAGDQTLSATSPTAKISVFFAGGNDVLLPNTTSVEVVADGGPGQDTLDGSADGDELRGGAGDDRLTPSLGNDTALGGDGDDTFVWQNGHGTDSFDGGGGQDTAEVTTGTAPDTLTVESGGGGTVVTRGAPGAFSVTAIAEVVDVRTSDGDDSVSLGGTPPSSVEIHAGSGTDRLIGGGGSDVLSGGSGNDTVDGGGGADVLDGADGDDTFAARDGLADQVRCGAGSDTAVLDTADQATDCETADRPAGPAAPAAAVTPAAVTPAPTPLPAPPRAPPAAGRLALAANQRLTPRSGVVTLAVSCPAATAGCRGTITLVTRSPVRIGVVRAVVRLSRASYALAAGRRGTVRLRLPRRFERLAARRARQLRATAVVAGADGTSRDVAATIRTRR